MASWREETWKKIKPKCKGCIYQGTDLPCEYILITGKSPQSQGAHIDPEGHGGCELYERGKKISRIAPIGLLGSTVSTYKTIERKNFAREKLESPVYFEMHKNRAGDEEIAKAAGVSNATVRRWRVEHDLPCNKEKKKEKGDSVGKRKPLSFDEKLAFDLYRKGKLDNEIAEKCGVKYMTISRWRKRRGLEANRFCNARKKAIDSENRDS